MADVGAWVIRSSTQMQSDGIDRKYRRGIAAFNVRDQGSDTTDSAAAQCSANSCQGRRCATSGSRGTGAYRKVAS